jgi:hypothetical protein
LSLEEKPEPTTWDKKNRQMFNFVSFYAKLKISKEAEPRKR